MYAMIFKQTVEKELVMSVNTQRFRIISTVEVRQFSAFVHKKQAAPV